MPACEVDCLTTYSCSGASPKEAIPGAVYSPYVVLKFKNGEKILTVGNTSSPPDNHAVISSFQYGFQPGTVGYGADFEIIDHGGLMYKMIVKALNKTLSKMKDEVFQHSFDFGWIVKHCDGRNELKTATGLTGKVLRGTLTSIEQVFEGGGYKLKVHFTGQSTRFGDVRLDDSMGDENNKISIKEALIELFTEHDPSFNGVEFVDKDGLSPLEFLKSDGGPDGPKGAWPANQQNPLAAARTWLSSLTTVNGRGILICYDPNSGKLVFKENPEKPDGNCCNRSEGTYVVNGGNCSPVLSFSPTIKWVLSSIPGSGAAAAGAASGANDAYVKPTIDIQKVGVQSSPTVQQHESMWRHPDGLAEGAATGLAAQEEANSNKELTAPFEAELKIHGDPYYSDPIGLISRTLSIVVINPFHVEECEWVTVTNCNSILSNKRYLILGLSHQISGGSFVTTIKVQLPTPNTHVDFDEPLGGEGCGTETFSESPGESVASEER